MSMKEQPTELDEIYLRFACAQCGAQRGEWCRSIVSRRVDFHDARYRAALPSINQWVDATRLGSRSAK